MSTSLSSSPAAHPSRSHAPLPDDEGQVVGGYTLADVIGNGAFSIIRRAHSISGGTVAVKIVRRSAVSKQPNAAQARKKIDHETTVWSALSHEHILPLFSVVHSDYADYFFTLYCPAGSLFDILKRDGRPALLHDDAGMMFRQVVRGLRYMHDVAGYVHRDMKLENVLVDETGVCRIGDFGMSRRIGEVDEEDEDEDDPIFHAAHTGVHRAASMALPASRRHHAFHSVTRHNSIRQRNSVSSPNPQFFNPGSLPYAAPELLMPRTAPLAPNPSQDMWALGVMLYALLIGRLPFFDSFEPRLQMKICNGVFEIPSGIGRGAERVLKGCLEKNVEERWTIAMVDNVAWGVGWGTEGDDVEEEEEEAETHKASAKSSRSCSSTRSWRLDLDNPSHEARSDLLQTRSSSRPRSRSRSQSQRRRSRGTSPAFNDLNTVLSNGTLSSYDSLSLVSPSSSLDRGRRPTRIGTRNCSSRSPSPSIVPSTPIDGAARFRSPMPVAEGGKSETLRRHDAPIPETDVLHWDDGRLYTSPSRSRTRDSPRSVRRNWDEALATLLSSSSSRKPKKRAESLPPAAPDSVSLPSWSTPELRGRKPKMPATAVEDRRFLTPVTPLEVVVGKGAIPTPRSRSVGQARHELDFYPLRPVHRPTPI
ncbi:kinase-like protein [Amanita muscaria]